MAKNRWRAAIALCSILVAVPGAAQERTAIKAGFSIPPNSGKKILVFRPIVTVGAQSTGGLFEPNADWTDQGRRNIAAALEKQQKMLGNAVIEAGDAAGADGERIAEYTRLFNAVADSVRNYQFFVGNRLPTKKHDNKNGVFDWSLGPGVASLPGADQADYALFIFNHDEFGSTGRKLLQAAGFLAAAAGVPVMVKSGEHLGSAGLVDLKTGDLVWLNSDAEMGGDVRTPEGAEKRVGQLLEEFPGSVVPPVAK